MMSGPASILPSSLDRVTTIVISPSSDRCFLSLRTILPTSPTPRPSIRILPEATLPAFLADLLSTSRISPLDIINILSGLVPTLFASSACLFSILYSPCTGKKNFGLANACISFNSSCLA